MRASAALAGPATVVRTAPTASASATAASSSPSGATIASSSSAAAATTRRRRARWPGSPTAARRSCARRSSGRAAGRRRSSAPARSVVPWPRSDEHAVDDRLDRRRAVLRLDDDRVLGERHDAEVVGRAERHRRRGDGARGQRPPAHRAAAVDEQAHGGLRLHPAPHAQPLGVDAPRRRRGPRRSPRCWRRCRGRRRRAGTARSAMRPVPRGRARPRRATSSIEPAGEAAGEVAEPGVGGPGHVGEHRHRLVGVLGHQRRRTPPRRARRRRATPGRSSVVARQLAARRRRLLGLVDRRRGPAGPPSARGRPRRGRRFSRVAAVAVGPRSCRTPRPTAR